MAITRFLTGITTSGTPHLGNYVGSIRPSVQASLGDNVENFYFLADYHALIKVDDPVRIQRSTLEIAASWLACGLDPEKVVFYRQSDVPEIPELCWMLTCVTGKGILNRAHAYKASVDKNQQVGNDPDADINAGLFMYPVLMGADILMFNAHKVPVGRDQVQHLEMARDMANAFNHRYGNLFFPPQEVIDDNVATLPGLDGRKMSKSYDNTIPLFASEDQLKKLIFSILTDSKEPGQAKETQGSALFEIFKAFASEAETKEFANEYAQGIAWGQAKQKVFDRLNLELSPLRQRYEALIQNPEEIEKILLAGALKARKLATPFMQQIRHAVGLRAMQAVSQKKVKSEKISLPSFKQYRESTGLFHFKLLSAKGDLLLQSEGFSSPKEAGLAIKNLQLNGSVAMMELANLVKLDAQASQEQLSEAFEALKQATEE
jgi:tryptophanyl-tRNA synthetase